MWTIRHSTLYYLRCSYSIVIFSKFFGWYIWHHPYGNNGTYVSTPQPNSETCVSQQTKQDNRPTNTHMSTILDFLMKSKTHICTETQTVVRSYLSPPHMFNPCAQIFKIINGSTLNL